MQDNKKKSSSIFPNLRTAGLLKFESAFLVKRGMRGCVDAAPKERERSSLPKFAFTREQHP